MALRRKTATQKATKDAILGKVQRRRNPVTSLYQLADEFGAPTYAGRKTSGGFRQHVVSTLGETRYTKIFSGNV